MNNVKHQPATPLPWKYDQGKKERSDWVIGEYPVGGLWPIVRPHVNNHNPANMQYIAHACNAYPKLVASLRESVLCFERPTRDLPINTMRALLRELGEDV